MRITIAQGAFLPVPPLRGGAVEKVWFALGKEFARAGHHVTHLSREFPGLASEESIEKVRHIRVEGFDTPRSLPVLKLLDFIYSLRVARRLAPSDILVSNTFWLPILVRSKKWGRLYVHVARYPRGQMRFYRHAARLQTVSAPIAEAIRLEIPGFTNLVSTIPYPLSDWSDNKAARTNDGSREKQILYVGRIHPEKGVQLLLNAFARLSSEQTERWKVVIVGPAETRFGGGGEVFLAELHRIAEPIRDKVEWIGPEFDADALAARYRRASLFVYPSLAERGETFGLAPLEAMSHGCPPLVSNLACFRDFIASPVSGFSFDHRSADPAGALAVRLAELLADPQRLSVVGRTAAARAEDFHLKKIAPRYLDDFATLLALP